MEDSGYGLYLIFLVNCLFVCATYEKQYVLITNLFNKEWLHFVIILTSIMVINIITSPKLETKYTWFTDLELIKRDSPKWLVCVADFGDKIYQSWGQNIFSTILSSNYSVIILVLSIMVLISILLPFNWRKKCRWFTWKTVDMGFNKFFC